MMGLRLMQKLRRRLFCLNVLVCKQKEIFNETHEAVWLRGVGLHDDGMHQFFKREDGNNDNRAIGRNDFDDLRPCSR